MVLEIPDNTPPEEVRRLVEDFEEKKKGRDRKSRSGMGEHFGKLKGSFGDPVEYQKMMRSEDE